MPKVNRVSTDEQAFNRVVKSFSNKKKRERSFEQLSISEQERIAERNTRLNEQKRKEEEKRQKDLKFDEERFINP